MHPAAVQLWQLFRVTALLLSHIKSSHVRVQVFAQHLYSSLPGEIASPDLVLEQ